MAAAAAAASPTDADATDTRPPSLLCLPPELLTTVASHLWVSGHASAWSALSRTCVAVHTACLHAVWRVDVPPLPPDGRHAVPQPLSGRW